MNNSLLDLKSLDNFSPAIFDIKSILEEGINLSNVYICGKDIKISLTAYDTAPLLIDENKFLACIVNIIKNAIEAIPEKGEINVSLEISEQVIIKIANNGEAIKNPENIFEAGFTTKSCGSGLGLHICAHNLKAQNAELRLAKCTPEITEFQITLPVV